ncbi:EVE domain-containing protein, partial [Pseudomonas sp. 10S4]
MAYWLMKSEPDELSIKDLAKLGKARWDGVR